MRTFGGCPFVEFHDFQAGEGFRTHLVCARILWVKELGEDVVP